MLAEEMNNWPNLDVEAPKKKRTKSMYARATDTGVDPAEAARRLNIDWDAAAEIEGEEEAEELEVPPAVGYGALYLVTALPILIGISMPLQAVFYPVSFMDPCTLSSVMAVEITVEGADVAAESSQPNIHGVNERQIGVDPVSLTPSTVTTVEDLAKPKFISSSLPCSATASPRTPRGIMKNLKKWRHQHPPPLPPFTRQRSAVMSSISSTEDIHLRRSKSCGEGRSCPPSDEFDLVLKKINHVRDQENEDHLVYDVNWEHAPSPRKSDACEQEFKCSALCIFLPNFSNKVKQVKPKKDQKEDQVSVLSRTVSLEKFECGSWASLPATISGEMNESMSIYFDLPVELIRTCGNEMQSPVTAAFVFERERKGCLKKNGTRRSCDSARHVRFSDTPPASHPSSPTSFCISPRLRKAREDFNSYLEEAQRA